MSEARPLVHQLFEAQAERAPDTIVGVCGGELLTYGDLDRRANQVAHHLMELGVGPEALVGICLEHSLELLVAILGVLKAGGAYLPIDPACPKPRLALMLDETTPLVVLSQERLLPQLPVRGAGIVCMDPGSAPFEGAPTTRPRSGVAEGNLVSVFYTSGSTGRPKAVLRSHRGGAGYRAWVQSTFGLTEHDRHLLKTSLGFTVFLSEIFWPLLTGAQVVVARAGGDRDSGYLVQLIADHKVTVLHAVPSLLRVLVDEPGLGACTSLRHIVALGEPMPSDLPDRLLDRLNVDLTLMYGTTEAPAAAFRRCARGEARRSLNAGRPLPDRRVFVVGRRLERLPIGGTGELWVGGNLARGYLARAALTAERFVPDPFSTEPGARLYRTGDLARWNEDGTLEFLGRLDDQVKIRGARVEPGEIEAALNQHPAVKASAVLPRDDGQGGRQLVAYVAAAGTPPDPGELRAFLAERLPDCMIPAAVLVRDSLPLLPSGKLDRRALHAPVPPQVDSPGHFMSPRTPAEALVAAIWAEILGLERVGVEDDFFALGGHSLRATQVLSRLRDSLGVDLPVQALFAAPTVAQLAALVSERLADLAVQAGNER